ncbi:glycosyltransferase family 4 protein [Candidatus Binatus sp.]|uniref:glycosyltransferase family 4 protein n=1 Tax=Candidatus Binatus sp. TaxID=2811406 RepID=UPI003C3CF484
MTAWNIITGEYPPQPGGVSDYTRLVAEGFAAAGDDVRIWAPPVVGPAPSSRHNIRVSRLPDHFGLRGLKILAQELESDRAARVLVEYVPHAFKMRAMNVPLCLMLLRRRHSDITVMFHEVAYPISRGQSIRHNVLGVVHQAMAAMLTRAASRIFVAAQSWTEMLARYAPKGRKIGWMPVPSTIPVVRDRAATLAVRTRLAPSESRLLGHFGTYGTLVADRLKPALESILSTHQSARVLLIGRNGEKFHDEFVREHPTFASRLFATGALAESDVSIHIGACDVMIQPYPDGITSRNTSALAGIAHGKATATTTGKLSEDFWQRSGAVFLAPDQNAEALARGTIDLINDRDRAKAMGCEAVRLYREVFDLEHTIAALREA